MFGVLALCSTSSSHTATRTAARQRYCSSLYHVALNLLQWIISFLTVHQTKHNFFFSFRCLWKKWERRSKVRWLCTTSSTCSNRATGCLLLGTVQWRCVTRRAVSSTISAIILPARVLMLPSDPDDHDGVLEQRPQTSPYVQLVDPQRGGCAWHHGQMSGEELLKSTAHSWSFLLICNQHGSRETKEWSDWLVPVAQTQHRLVRFHPNIWVPIFRFVLSLCSRLTFYKHAANDTMLSHMWKLGLVDDSLKKSPPLTSTLFVPGQTEDTLPPPSSTEWMYIIGRTVPLRSLHGGMSHFFSFLFKKLDDGPTPDFALLKGTAVVQSFIEGLHLNRMRWTDRRAPAALLSHLYSGLISFLRNNINMTDFTQITCLHLFSVKTKQPLVR